MSTARLSPLQQDTFVRLRAAHLANMRMLAAHRKQRIADLQVRTQGSLSNLRVSVSTCTCWLAVHHRQQRIADLQARTHESMFNRSTYTVTMSYGHQATCANAAHSLTDSGDEAWGPWVLQPKA